MFQAGAEFTAIFNDFVERTKSSVDARERIVPWTGSSVSGSWTASLSWVGSGAWILANTDAGIELGVGADIGQHSLAGSRIYLDTLEVRPLDGFYHGRAECSVRGTWSGTVVFVWHYAIQP